MPKIFNDTSYTIPSGGNTTKAFDLEENFDLYIIGPASATTLSGTMAFTTTGTAYKGLTFDILYLGGVTSDSGGGDVVSFFGEDLTDEEALTKLRIVATYDGSAWSVGKFPYNLLGVASISGSQIADGSIGANQIGDGKVTLAKLADLTDQGYLMRGDASGVLGEFDAKSAGFFVMGDGTDVISQAISGDITVDGSGVAAIGANKVITAMILDANVTVAKVESSLKHASRDIDVSFETDEIGDFKIRMDYPGTLTGIYAYVTKAIAGTDDATITPKNNAGTTMTDGVITFTAADARGTAETSVPSANNTFVAGDVLTFTCAKTTEGGKAMLSLKILRS